MDVCVEGFYRLSHSIKTHLYLGYNGWVMDSLDILQKIVFLAMMEPM